MEYEKWKIYFVLFINMSISKDNKIYILLNIAFCLLRGVM